MPATSRARRRPADRAEFDGDQAQELAPIGVAERGRSRSTARARLRAEIPADARDAFLQLFANALSSRPGAVRGRSRPSS
jgi:hypothetical protein